jgi:adenine-specific DNA-methyltransferase
VALPPKISRFHRKSHYGRQNDQEKRRNVSRLTDLIAQAKAKDPDLGQELEREFKTLASRRSFGLNFERHLPESVELPGRPVRKGDKVRVLPPRRSTEKGDQRLWRVRSLERKNGGRVAPGVVQQRCQPLASRQVAGHGPDF